MIGWNHYFRFLHEVKQVWLGALEFRWRLENGRSSDHCNLLLGLNSSAVLKTIAAITAFFSLSFTKLSLTRGSRSAASLKVGSFSNGRRCFTTINEINIYFLYFNMITNTPSGSCKQNFTKNDPKLGDQIRSCSDSFFARNVLYASTC